MSAKNRDATREVMPSAESPCLPCPAETRRRTTTTRVRCAEDDRHPPLTSCPAESTAPPLSAGPGAADQTYPAWIEALGVDSSLGYWR